MKLKNLLKLMDDGEVVEVHGVFDRSCDPMFLGYVKEARQSPCSHGDVLLISAEDSHLTVLIRDRGETSC